MNIDETLNNIKSKIGEETSSMIADDLANLLVQDKALHDTINNKDEEIKRLKADKDTLVNANANLLQKLPLGKEDDDGFTRKEEEKKPFDFRSVFSNGKFKR